VLQANNGGLGITSSNPGGGATAGVRSADWWWVWWAAVLRGVRGLESALLGIAKVHS
jgi:hypothetical protein